jgi:hypothetical protein
MESVVFDGKEFAKASVLAEKFGYTQDYLGQLCRGKKVDARLVGRAWYINLDSLLSHRTARYKSPAKEVEVESKKTPNHYLSRIDVEPILKQKTVKILRNDAGKLTEFPVKYVGDDYSLIPHVNKSAISSYLHIEPAEAEKITVHKEKSTLSITNFKAESLPEFSLSGQLDVEGIPEVTEESLVLPSEPAHKVEIAVSEPALVPERPARSLKLRTIARPAPKAPVESVARPPVIPKKLVTTAIPLKSKANPRKGNSAASFAPASVRRVQKVATQEESSFAWPLVGLLVGLVSGFFIIATEVSVKANQNSYTDNFIIKIENLTQTAEVILAKIY